MHPQFDPVAVSIGPVQVHWYGIMYLVGFLGGAALGAYRAGKPTVAWEKTEIPDLLFFIAIGVILGGRLGYVVFYNLSHYLHNPIEALYIWTGGMSFHGGLLGVMVATWLYARKTQRPFLAVTDFIAPLVAVGLGAGRVGNFINQELWGRITDVPWAVIFPAAGQEPRHPSQLYEALLEGIVLFVILWAYSTKPRSVGAVSGVFLLCYGVFRFLVEFFRVPDSHIGYLAFDWITMGQVLTVPMVLLGLWLIVRPTDAKVSGA